MIVDDLVFFIIETNLTMLSDYHKKGHMRFDIRATWRNRGCPASHRPPHLLATSVRFTSQDLRESSRRRPKMCGSHQYRGNFIDRWRYLLCGGRWVLQIEGILLFLVRSFSQLFSFVFMSVEDVSKRTKRWYTTLTLSTGKWQILDPKINNNKHLTISFEMFKFLFNKQYEWFVEAYYACEFV